jgi:glycosyltransferase involved in cell wall biosynthesis
MKTLAICIPTYRRPDMLQRCILSAINAAGSRPITIVVADDSSSDVNVPTMQALCSAHSFIKWHRNPVNLGIDLNIQNVVDKSACDYAWLIGEDDIFLPGSIERTHDFLQLTAAPFVFCNYQFANEDFSSIVGVAFSGKPDATMPVPSFIAEQLWSVGFIGSTIVARDAWAATSPEPYRGTYFTHVGRIVDLLATQASVAIRPVPSIANRSQGADTFTWKHDSFGVFFGFETMCRTSAERHADLADALAGAISTYRERSGYLSLKSTFRLRSQGAFDRRQFSVYIRRAPIGRWRKVWLAALAVSPRFALRPFAAAYVAWVRRRDAARRAS